MTQKTVGRPSNRDERYEQVMQALVQCVGRFGLEGTTLSKVAEVAGLSRPLIRHHLGNRAEMIGELQDYVLRRFDEDVEALVTSLPKTGAGPFLIDLLFSPRAVTDPGMTMAFAALTAHARTDPSLQQKCQERIFAMEEAVAHALAADAPEAEAARRAAHGIVALYFNLTAFEALNMPHDWRERAKAIAYSIMQDAGGRR